MTNITREIEALYEELVPSMGKADTEAGEILRALGRIRYRYYNDGDMIGLDYGNETCNAPARYLMGHGRGTRIPEIIGYMWGGAGFNIRKYEELLEALEEEVYYLLLDNPSARTNHTEDMWSYSRPEDTEYDEDEDEDWDW